MCGITGIINFNHRATFENANIKKMTDSLSHRGPDDEGYLVINSNAVSILGGDDTPKNDLTCVIDYYSKQKIKDNLFMPSYLTFGHRRLTILDLNITGHQPMSYLNRYWIVYNGEIYNYLEIKQELEENGLLFKTKSDTEVILASYHKWGPECLKKFNGMWAFAIYDHQKSILFMSRDRFGIKPLHYYIDEHKLIFASEAKAILNNDYVVSSPNIRYIEGFLKSGPKAYLEETAFENIFNFPSGSYIEENIDSLGRKKLEFKKYWKIRLGVNINSQGTSQDYSKKYLQILNEAVRLRMRADVKIGTALSGGLDSSAVAYFVNENLKSLNSEEKQNTFSLVFNKNKLNSYCDESDFVKIIVNHLNIKSYTTEPNEEEVFSYYKKTVYHMDFPQEDSLMSCIFTYKLVNEKGVRVTLDGQGADELQAGYLHYLRNFFSNLKLREIIKQYRFFNQVPNAKNQIIYGIIFNIIKRFKINLLIVKLLKVFNKVSNPFCSVNKRLYDDFHQNLQNLLHFGDRSSMMFAVESRYPFLDYRMVKFWMGVPESLKINDGWTKYLARLSMEKLLPKEIVWRKDKMGWEIPQKKWFRGKIKEFVIQTVLESSFLDHLSVNKNIVYKLNSTQLSDSELKKIIKLFNLALWHNVFFGNK